MKKVFILGNYVEGKPIIGGVQMYNFLLFKMFKSVPQISFLKTNSNKVFMFIYIFLKLISAPKGSIFWICSMGYHNLFVILKKIKRFNVVFTIHSLEKVSKKGFINKKHRFIEDFTLKYGDYFIFPSNKFFEDSCEKYLIFNSSNSIVIFHPNPFEEYLSTYENKNKGKYILTMGGFSLEKGKDKVENILQALNVIGNCKYKWVGSSPTKDFSKLDIKFNHLLDLREYTTSIEEKKNIIKNADIVLVPSNYESFSFVTVEACYLGVPLIVSNNVGISDLVQKYNSGLVCNFNSVDDIISCILNIHGNRNHYSINAQKMSQEFDLKKIRVEYLAFISSL